MFQIVASLINEARVIIYDCNMFKTQATDDFSRANVIKILGHILQMDLIS